MNNMISGIVGISLGIVMLSSVFMYVVHNTSTAGWSSGEVAMWSVLGLSGVIGVVYGTLSVFGLV